MNEILVDLSCTDKTTISIPFWCMMCDFYAWIVGVGLNGNVDMYRCNVCGFSYSNHLPLTDLGVMLYKIPSTWQVCSHDGYPLH